MTATNDPIRYEVDRCPNCGFCSPTIDEPEEISPDDIRDPVYRRVLETRSPHECAAYLLSIHGHHRDAAYMLLHSAWLHEGNGIWLRNLAIREMLKEPPQCDDLIVMADMLRCVGDLERASIVTDAILSEKGNAHLWKKAAKELELIGSGDTRPDVISEDAREKTAYDVTMRIEVSETDYPMMISSDEPILVRTMVYRQPSDGDIVAVTEGSFGRERGFTIVERTDDGMTGRQKDRIVIGTSKGPTFDTEEGRMMNIHLQKEKMTEVWPINAAPDPDHTMLRSLEPRKGLMKTGSSTPPNLP